MPHVPTPTRTAIHGETPSNATESERIVLSRFEGLVSFYGNEFEGRKTASGQIFSNDGFTAAHPTLPFGTKLRVTNKENGKTILVVVNDRGPFKGKRVLDVTRACAEALDFVRQGVTTAVIEVIK